MASSELNPYAPPISSVAPPAHRSEAQMLASRGTRFVAVLLDQMLFVASLLPLLGLLVVVANEGRGVLAGYGVWIGGLLPAAGLLVYQWYLIATSGQSLGKRWMGIRIVRLDGSPVGFVSGVLLRNWLVRLLGLVPYLGGFVAILDGLLIFGPDYRCLHDHIARTKVISAPS